MSRPAARLVQIVGRSYLATVGVALAAVGCGDTPATPARPLDEPVHTHVHYHDVAGGHGHDHEGASVHAHEHRHAHGPYK